MATARFEIYHPERLLSAHNAAHLQNWIYECLESGHTTLLIDFQYVSFMDSSGLGALALAQKAVTSAGGRLALCSVQGQARILLELTDMITVFEIYADEPTFHSVLSAC